MTSFATKSNVSELARHLSDSIPKLAGNDKRAKVWTEAVHKSFSEYGKARQGWNVHPETKAKKGEYLCDFMLFEDGYGPRIACESQWLHHPRFGKHFDKLDWSFDKLRGVKADIKVFIYEEDKEDWEKIWPEYLTNYALLSPDEAFLILKFDHSFFRASWWQPSKPGVHSKGEITFEQLA